MERQWERCEEVIISDYDIKTVHMYMAYIFSGILAKSRETQYRSVEKDLDINHDNNDI